MEARSDPDPNEVCECPVEEHDVLGLFEQIRSRRPPLPSGVSLSALSRSIRAKAKGDLSIFSEDMFGAILGFGMTMLTRCQLYIEKRLAEADQHAGEVPSPVPADLIDEQWLERAERISRFCAEMAAVRARIRHVNGLNNEECERKRRPRRPRLVSAVDEGEGEAGTCQESPRSRRERA